MTLRVLLFSPLAGRDPLSGDTSYTEALIRQPPVGVTYVTYDAALEDGSVVELGRRPRRGRRFQPLLFLIRSGEMLLRRTGLMFREPTWWIRIEPGQYDLVHQHLFVLRQCGARTPVLSTAGYPLTVLYRFRDGWSPLRIQVATVLERAYAAAADAHVPWLRCQSTGGHMAVYSESFREWLVKRGVARSRVSLVGTFLESAPLPPPGDRMPRAAVFIGRAFHAKGGAVALDALDLLRQEDPGWTLTVVTSAYDAARIPAADGLTVFADLDRHTILTTILPKASILLAPTHSDCGVPYAQLEALRAGVCVVTSRLEWLDDRLTGPGVRRVEPTALAVAQAALDIAKGLSEEARGARALFDHRYTAEVWHEAELLPAYRAAAVAPRSGGVLVVAPRRDVSDNRFDGFALRHRSILQELARRSRVVVAVIDDDSPADLSGLPAGVDVLHIPRVPPANGRFERLHRSIAAARGRLGTVDHAWSAWIEASSCDVALTVGPWIQSNHRPVWRHLPSVHLFEEELMSVADLAPQSLQARAFRRLEWAIESLSPAQPEVVVAISQPELRNAARRFPWVDQVCVPFGLDDDEWPVATSTSIGTEVLVVGNFAETRNAHGLADVLSAVQRSASTLKFRLVSGPGIHESLRRSVEAGTLTVEHMPLIMNDLYRRSWASLTPARVVTGQKTTILQAWASGVPVVASPEAAATVSADDALLVGHDAEEMVTQLESLRDSPVLRDQLTARGLEVARERHRATVQNAAIVRLLQALPRTVGRP